MGLNSKCFYLAKIILILACVWRVSSDGLSYDTYSDSEVIDTWMRMASLRHIFPVVSAYSKCFMEKIIPYTLSDTFSSAQKQIITSFFDQIQNVTCLRWIERDVLQKRFHKLQVNFEHIRDSELNFICNQFVYWDRTRGFTVKIRLGKQCFTDATVLHLIMHGLGYIHEHQRLDRDCYIEVGEPYLYKRDFYVVYDDYFERWPYDINSITHYHPGQTFGIKSRHYSSIFLYEKRVQEPPGLAHGTPNTLSSLDVYKINFRYCGGPDYCSINKKECASIEQVEKQSKCKQLYEVTAKAPPF